jgi:hypothetical protein
MAAPARRDSGPALDFAVIGAAKAGTTALFNLLSTHPELHLPERKELPYFAHPKYNYFSYYESPFEFFADAFKDRRPGQLCGTVSPQYLFGWPLEPQAQLAGPLETIIPSRIREAYPDTKLIAILRDPVARARSHHRMVAMAGYDSRPFDRAIDYLLQPEILSETRTQPNQDNNYVVVGEYARLLQGFFDVFPREQLLVLFHDDLERDPAAVCETVFAFLGVDRDFRPPNLESRHNEGASRRRFAWLDPMRWQRAAVRKATLRGLWRRLPRSLRLRILRAFDLTAWRLFLWNRVRVDAGEGAKPDPAGRETLARLRAHYREDGQRLRTLLGVDPPWEQPERADSAADRPANRS